MLQTFNTMSFHDLTVHLTRATFKLLQQIIHLCKTLRHDQLLYHMFREEIIASLLDVQHSLQAEAYVGMLTSNFGRMLDFMRATVGCKANRVYLDVMHGPNPLEHIRCRTKCVF